MANAKLCQVLRVKEHLQIEVGSQRVIRLETKQFAEFRNFARLNFDTVLVHKLRVGNIPIL